MRSIFISYSRKDQKFVNNLVEKLKRYGAKIWKDDLRIAPGDSIIGEIGKGLEKSEFIIVILSPNSIKSENVKKEISIATTLEIKKQIKIIPILYKKCEIPIILVDQLYLDFSNPNKREAEFQKLIFRLGLINEPMPEDIKDLIDKVFNLDIYGLHITNDLWVFNTYLINTLLYNIFSKTYAFDSYLIQLWGNHLLKFDSDLIDRVTKYISELKSERKSKYDELPELWKRWENMEISISNIGLGVEQTDLKLTKEKVIQLLEEIIEKKLLWRLGGFGFDKFFRDYWEKNKKS